MEKTYACEQCKKQFTPENLNLISYMGKASPYCVECSPKYLGGTGQKLKEGT